MLLRLSSPQTNKQTSKQTITYCIVISEFVITRDNYIVKSQCNTGSYFASPVHKQINNQANKLLRTSIIVILKFGITRYSNITIKSKTQFVLLHILNTQINKQTNYYILHRYIGIPDKATTILQYRPIITI